MSAIDDLKAKPKKDCTPLDFAILACDEMGGEATAGDAAEELASLRAKLERAEKIEEAARLVLVRIPPQPIEDENGEAGMVWLSGSAPVWDARDQLAALLDSRA